MKRFPALSSPSPAGLPAWRGRLARASRGALAAAWLVTGLAQAGDGQPGPMDFLYTTGIPPRADNAGPAPRVWKVGEFSALRLVPAEPGSVPSQHPATIGAARWRALLALVELPTRGDRAERLFSADELEDLAPALARALAVAGAQDDLLILSTSRRGSGFSTPLSVTARAFVQGGRLNLIVHDTRRDAYSDHRVTRSLPRFDFGQRATASPAVLRADGGAQALRSDWVAWALDAPAAAAAPAVSAAPAIPVVPAVAAPPAGASAPAAAGPPAAAASRARDAAFYAEQGERLRGLQRLRDAGLLSEEEFQRKRRAILDSL